MANLLTITKTTDIFFTFVLNGDSANAIKNSRNNVTLVGNQAHFKTENGANLIKEQNVLFGNITIIDGVTTLIPSSPDDLINKLDSVNFFDWTSGSGSGGVDRFDDLNDTFEYFGKNGQIPRVNESQLKLEAYELPNTDYLNYFPTPLVPNQLLRVKADGSGYELFTMPTFGNISMIDFGYLTEDTTEFVIPENTTAKWALVNFGVWVPLTTNNVDKYNTFNQVSGETTVTFTNTLVENNYVIIFYQ